MAIGMAIVIIGVLIGLGVLIYSYVLTNRAEEFPKDNVRVINYQPQYADGYREGLLIERKWGKDRSVIEFRPSDINYNEIHKVKNQKVVVKNSLIDAYFYPKGVLSKECAYMYLLPPRVDLLSKPDRKMFSTKFLEEMEKVSATDDVVDIQRKREKVINDLLNLTEGKDMVSDYLENDKRLNKTMGDKIKELREDRKFSGMSGPPNHSGR